MDAALRSWLYHTFTPQRRTGTTKDLRGNEVPVYTAQTPIKGKFEYLAGQANHSSRETVIYQQRFIVGPNADVKSTDRITWDGRTFEVQRVYIRYDLDGEEHHRVAYLEEIDGIA